MRRLVFTIALLSTGWLLGWYSHRYWQPEPMPGVVIEPEPPALPARPAVPSATAAPDPDDVFRSLLVAGEYEAAVEHYERLQRQSELPAAQQARQALLDHARKRIGLQRHADAERLLQRLLVAAWRDVEVRRLLAQISEARGELALAIDRLYEARGHAWDPETQARLTARIRALAGRQARLLREGGDPAGLLEFYRHLTQLEPDHAPYFIGLAGAQQARGDTDAAMRSLQLVANDPDHGAQARTLLSRLMQESGHHDDGVTAAATQETGGIALQRHGSHFLVEARPDRGGALDLLIDTGASMTIITPAALERRQIRYTDTGRTGVFSTANGRVQAPVYRIAALAVGDREVRELDVGVLDLGGQSGIDGLLGMNFLRHFQFFIDQNRSLLSLSPQGER
jgi:clan AA aspartic protease (TIGR02281 family)